MAEDILLAIKNVYGTWIFIAVLVGLGLYYLIMPSINEWIEFRRKERVATREAEQRRDEAFQQERVAAREAEQRRDEVLQRKEEQWLQALREVSASHDQAIRDVTERQERNVDKMVAAIDMHRKTINELMGGNQYKE